MNIYTYLEKVRNNRPLVHHLTNWVTIYDCANITRAFGALPVMAHAKEEAGDMARIASALVLNIGTLTRDMIESMILAATVANKKGIPVILDAVGVGATQFRDEMTMLLIKQVRIDVIKGNGSEIARLAGFKAQTKGVESGNVEGNLLDVAKALASDKSCISVITGKHDIVSNGKNSIIIKNGDPMMGSIVGTGCMAASVIGAFCAVAENKDYLTTSACALSCFGIAGEIAAKQSSGPGSFKNNFYDCVYNLNKSIIDNMQQVEMLM